MKRLGLGLAVLLVGCSGGTGGLNTKINWYQAGYEEAVRGQVSRLVRHADELGSEANRADYERGYSEGNEEFCNPQMAYMIGFSGVYYHGVCEGREDSQKFLLEWKRGWADQD